MYKCIRKNSLFSSSYTVETKNTINDLWFFCCNLKDYKFYLELQYLHEQIPNSFDQRSSNIFCNGLRADPILPHYRLSGVELNSLATFKLSLIFTLAESQISGMAEVSDIFTS